MNHRTVEDKTQGNQTAERYLALLEEYAIYEDRLQKALVHKEAFSEKVLAKVSGEYKTKMDQLQRERSVLEAQLQAELSAFERQLQAALPARQRFHEEIEELELRHLTGELPTKEYTRRKAALDSQRVGGPATEMLQRNIDYYRAVLQSVAMNPGDQGAVAANAVDSDSAWHEDGALESVTPQAYATEYAEEHYAAAPYETQEADDWGDEAAYQTNDPRAYAEPEAEMQSEEDYFATQMPEAEPETQAGYGSISPDHHFSEHDYEEEATAEEYYDPAAVADEMVAEDEYYSEVTAEEPQAKAYRGREQPVQTQEEDDFFQNEFGGTGQQTAESNWYAQQGRTADPNYAGRLQQQSDEALEDLDEFADDSGFAAEDVDIPEELLMDEDDEEFLQPEAMDDSAALMQSTEALLEDESYDDVFEEDLVDPDTGNRTLEPAVILREGMPDEKVFFMTNNILSIGRGPDNDIQLSTDTSVSRHHSRILYEDDEYWIADLGSSNGTIVNGARVSKTVLTGEDEISIGQTVLKFKFC